MKKVFKWALVALISIAAVVISFSLFIQIRGIPSFEVPSGKLKVELTPERIARGEKLSSMLCANCHQNLETGKLTGQEMKDAGDQFGFLYSQNITADKEFGIGTWTDWELYYLLRTGVKRDGKYAPPYMAKLPHMADEDVYAIIAYLRSGLPAVAAAAVADQPCKPSFLTKFLCFVAFEPLPLPERAIVVPDSSKTLEFGKYLAINLDCWTCHSADFKTMNVMEPEKTPGYFGGGNPLLDLEGHTIVSLNLTPDPATGIGAWSENQFVTALRTGRVEGQEALRYPMIPYTKLEDHEAKAIFAYLRSIPPIKNQVERVFY